MGLIVTSAPSATVFSQRGAWHRDGTGVPNQKRYSGFRFARRMPLVRADYFFAAPAACSLRLDSQGLRGHSCAGTKIGNAARAVSAKQTCDSRWISQGF
jgi:hypothetical protein